jgi:hypothetical protein
MQTEIISEVLVFKTNLQQEADIDKAATLFDIHPDIVRWNVDYKDIDHVLRIEAINIGPHEVVALLTAAGYTCEELPD